MFAASLRAPALLRGGVSTLMNISLLAASHCQLWPLCCGPIRQSERRSWLDTSLRSLLKSQRPGGPLHAAIHSAEEAVFRPRKQESAIKSYTSDNKSNVGDAERRKDGSPRGLAGATVTRAALLGTALSADRSHEILHIATYSSHNDRWTKISAAQPS